MTVSRSYVSQEKEPLRKEGFFSVDLPPPRRRGSGTTPAGGIHKCASRGPDPRLRGGGDSFVSSKSGHKTSGNVLFYIFLAIGLIAALTYAFIKDSRENFAAQNAVNISEALFAQVNMIRSAVQQCVMEYPEGGAGTCGGSVVACDNAPCSCADLNHDGVIDSINDNPNLPYPLNPDSALNPNAVAGFAAVGDTNVRSLTCVGAPATTARMFTGVGNQGRFLPPPPPGFPEWTYANNAAGVYIQTTAPNDAAATNAITRLRNKFNTCQAEVNYGGCGATCFTAWLLRVTGAACL